MLAIYTLMQVCFSQKFQTQYRLEQLLTPSKCQLPTTKWHPQQSLQRLIPFYPLQNPNSFPSYTICENQKALHPLPNHKPSTTAHEEIKQQARLKDGGSKLEKLKYC
uniref:Uncharacterized protein n=1 Tax=Opuntia streptacantha TaxID=393608 RepID=A0A7C8ZH83_OPUST